MNFFDTSEILNRPSWKHNFAELAISEPKLCHKKEFARFVLFLLREWFES